VYKPREEEEEEEEEEEDEEEEEEEEEEVEEEEERRRRRRRRRTSIFPDGIYMSLKVIFVKKNNFFFRKFSSKCFKQISVL
jgi:hypothetical protein